MKQHLNQTISLPEGRVLGYAEAGDPKGKASFSFSRVELFKTGSQYHPWQKQWQKRFQGLYLKYIQMKDISLLSLIRWIVSLMIL